MELSNMRQRSYRITSFVTVQLIALIGWIIVQSIFSLSPLSGALSFQLKLVIEAIWWIATLVIMFLLFRRVYSGFVKAVLELEEANRSLRKTTNTILSELSNPADQ
jgi:tellurite resistance protein TehA-like permease